MKKFLATLLALVFCAGALIAVVGCGSGNEGTNGGETVEEVEVAFADLTSTGKEQNVYATKFSIEHFQDSEKREYSKIDIFDKKDELNTSWFLAPQGVKTVTGLASGVELMTWTDRQNIMVSSSNVMALVNAMDELDRVSMVTDDTTWYIDEINTAIENGSIQQVGQYDTPDFEKIAVTASQDKVTFAVYSTMIDYVDGLEDNYNTYGIRIMRDQSSSESHPLARVEWVKVFGEILDARESADAIFTAQDTKLKETVSKIENVPESERKTVLVCYIVESGTGLTYKVRKADDYIMNMVKLGGGATVEGVPTGTSSATVESESFIQYCHDADYMLYSWTEGGVTATKAWLEQKIDWIKDTNLYKNGNIYKTQPDFYQSIDTIGDIIADVYEMLYGDVSAMKNIEKM